MQENMIERCKRLRKLHDRVVEELRVLKEDVQNEENEGFENPVMTVNIIKSLQQVLNTLDVELAKCPAEY